MFCLLLSIPKPAQLLNLKTVVAGLNTAYLSKFTLAFEFSVLTLTVPGLRLRKVQNPQCCGTSTPVSSALTAVFGLKGVRLCYRHGRPRCRDSIEPAAIEVWLNN